MNTGRRDLADQALRHRKLRDRAAILPLAGIILLMPPVADIFELHAKLAGIPFALIYILTVWVLLIAGACALSWPLRHAAEADPLAEEEHAPTSETRPEARPATRPGNRSEDSG